MSMFIEENKKNLTSEIRELFQELKDYEEAWEGRLTDNDFIGLFLEGKDRIMRRLVVSLVDVGHDLSEKLLSSEDEKESLQVNHAYQGQELVAARGIIQLKELENTFLRDEIASLKRVWKP